MTAGDFLSEADGAHFLEFFLPFMSVDASQRFGVCLTGGLEMDADVLP